MDPYKTPPQSLKDIFKELRIIKNTDDPDMTTLKVLDFGIPSASAFTASLDLFEKPLDCLQSHRHVTDPIALGTTSFSRNVHTVNDFPGRQPCHLLTSSETPQQDASPSLLSYSVLF